MTLHSLASRARLNALTGARGPAALMVFAQHAGEAGFLPFVFPSSLAVSFFFVLSGFVLAYVYADDRSLGFRFYRARFARIWPATILSTVFLLLILPRHFYLPQQLPDWTTGWILLTVITLFQSLIPIPDFYFAFNAVTWSISVEWCFYLVFPILNRGVRSRTIMTLICVAMMGAALTLIAIQLQLPAFNSARLAQPTWHGVVYINPVTRLFEFVMGICAGQLWLNQAFRARIVRMFDDVKQFNFALGETCLESFLLFGLILILCFLVQLFFSDLSLPSPLQLLVFQWSSSVILVGIVFVLALERGFIAKNVMSHPAMMRLGELSFGIYLFHQPILNWCKLQRMSSVYQPRIFVDLPQWTLVIMILMVTIILSAISHDWFEKPARRYLRGSS